MARVLRPRPACPERPLRKSIRKRKAESEIENPRKLKSRKSNTPRAKNHDTSTITQGDESIPPLWQPPKNPQETLQGLPAELRLQIYEHLCESTILHVHHHEDRDFVGQGSRFTWTSCKLANPKCSLLCANPKWSGLCCEADRCTYKINAPPEPRGLAALAATCKFIRNEAWQFLLRHSVISIDSRNLSAWLYHLEQHAPRQLQQLRRITLAGPSSYMFHWKSELAHLRDKVPNLEAIGVQSQVPQYQFTSPASGHGREVQLKSRWHAWHVLQATCVFDPSVTVALEGLMWCKHLHWYSSSNSSVPEEQIVVRIIREGKTGGIGDVGTIKVPPDRMMQIFPWNSTSIYGWQDDDVKLEVYRPNGVIESSPRARWKAWWRAKELKHYT